MWCACRSYAITVASGDAISRTDIDHRITGQHPEVRNKQPLGLLPGHVAAQLRRQSPPQPSRGELIGDKLLPASVIADQVEQLAIVDRPTLAQRQPATWAVVHQWPGVA